MYDPMRVAGVGPGSRVGIVGLGGLGQMGVKIAAALGCEVTAISRGVAKRAFAIECGASSFVDATSDESLADAAGTLDLILNTVPVYHDYLRFQALLRPRRERRGLSGAGPPRQVLLGLHVGLGGAFVAGSAVGAARSRVAASGIGGIRATQEVMDLCASRGIAPDVEVVGAGEMHRGTRRWTGNDAGKRFVLDVASLRKTRRRARGSAAAEASARAAGSRRGGCWGRSSGCSFSGTGGGDDRGFEAKVGAKTRRARSFGISNRRSSSRRLVLIPGTASLKSGAAFRPARRPLARRQRARHGPSTRTSQSRSRVTSASPSLSCPISGISLNATRPGVMNCLSFSPVIHPNP